MKTKSPVSVVTIEQFQFGPTGKDVADNNTTHSLNIKDCSPPAYSPVPMPDNLQREEVRLQTFDCWPHNFISPQKLARTGFYFIGPNNDNVKCYFCKVEIGCWEQGDDEVTEHMRWSQNCPLLRRRETNNVPIDDGELDLLLPPLTYDVCGPCGVVDVRHGSYAESSFTLPPLLDTPTSPTLKHPDHPEYAIEAARFRSFEDWPKTMKQKPQDLSDAGFFYTQKGDRVKCFSCGGGLRDWDEYDVPWEQHALWFSKCEYLKLIKGQSYIDSILEKKRLQDECESNASDDEENRPIESLLEKCNSSFESASTSGSDAESGIGHDDGPSEKKVCDSKLCKICYSCEYNTCFLPCGHVVACAKCASSVTKCPMCRKPFDGIMRVYFS
ncbi:Death-associated inhibitor of apoptosis 1 [Pseudolycoriella hygida]|uniref:Death-associated inhibitor of apoptosis 1 n=1 Tax=Pseudolycoriella hygida TaxID=35572 RepID=A0A9Q0N2V9_9DIPT|nr:Death-associated inhibitor of apoptosis 1 [Pseudolycoriella hygida]